MKSAFSNASTESSEILSTAILHKRRPQKRVRFALKLESLEETTLPTSGDVTPSLVPISTREDTSPILIPISSSPLILPRSNSPTLLPISNSISSMPISTNRIIDPWRPNGSLYGTYVEYLEKQDAFASHESLIRRSPLPPLSVPEPNTEPRTYTHTFVIQSKSPDITIDSITVSSPNFHLPRICHPSKKANKYRSPVFDTYIKQQLTLSTASRILPSPKKLPNIKPTYASVHAALKRAELSLPPTNGLHANNKITRAENLFGSKLIHDPIQSKKMVEIIPKPLPSTNNQINHFSDRTILPNYTKKPRMHNRNQRTNDELNRNAPYFFQDHETDLTFQPIIHSNR